MKSSIAPDLESARSRLERLLQRLAARRGVRHAIVGATSLDGSWSWTGALGDAGPGGPPMQPDTPWFLASVTKLYIATVFLMLVEQGLVDMETPISVFLPDDLSDGLHVYDGVDYTHLLTSTHLLGHLSGLPDYLDERPVGAPSLMEEALEGEDRMWSPFDAVTRARDLLSPHFPPSDPRAPKAKIRYSDTNYQLLVVIAEHLTGSSMAELYERMLFEPLGLRHTWLPGHQPLDQTGDPAAVWIGDQPLVDRPLAKRSFGDLYSTINDMLLFGRALFGGEAFDHPRTGELMRERFRRFGFPTGAASLRAPSWPIEYGLGMMRFNLSRLLSGGMQIPTMLGHTGSSGSWLWYLPENSLIIAGTVDQATAATVPFRSVARALAGQKVATP